MGFHAIEPATQEPAFSGRQPFLERMWWTGSGPCQLIGAGSAVGGAAGAGGPSAPGRPSRLGAVTRISIEGIGAAGRPSSQWSGVL